MGFNLAFNLSFSMAFVSAFFVLFYVRERVCKAKHLQFVSGMEVLVFWGVNLVFDLIIFLFTVVCLLIVLICFNEDGYNTFGSLGKLEFSLELFMPLKNICSADVFCVSIFWILDVTVDVSGSIFV